ncbi:hypothetical protein ACROYT_G026275 [Oculina patagonica]
MSNKETWWLPVVNSTGNTNFSSTPINNSRTAPPTPVVYVFTPAGFTTKLVLCLMIGVIIAMGVVGNCFMLLFLWSKQKRTQLQSTRFVKNLNMYLRNLALSDLLSCLTTLPLLCIQITFDVFQSGWACKIVRYFQFIFAVITINILVVISLEKYLSTRKVPRTFSASTMSKLVFGAWVAGLLVMLIPSATYDGQRVDLNKTHFTVICSAQENFYPFRLIIFLFPIQFVMPFLFITFVNISLARTVWIRGRRKIASHPGNNPLKAKLMATKVRGITVLILVTFTFFVTYFFFLGYLTYKQIARPDLAFQTDYVLRYGSGATAYLNSSINVAIYFVQMRDFQALQPNMSNKETWWLPVVNSTGNTNFSSTPINNSRTAPPTPVVYVFTPAGFTTKLVLCLMIGAIIAMGVVGNCFMLLLLWSKQKKTQLQSTRFVKNLNMYLRNLALSDLLSCLTTLPLLCIQITFDVFQSGWACKIVRYFQFIFAVITINILVVISLEKYLSTRKVPRTFSASTMSKLVFGAWVAGLLVMLIPSATYDGQRVDLSRTHFTVICKNQENFYPFRLIIFLFPIQFVMPFLFITFVNISLARTVWIRRRRKIASHPGNNPLRAKLMAIKVRGITLLILVTFTFFATYFFFLGYLTYKLIAKPDLAFQTDYVLRYGSGATAYLNSTINVAIYLARMRDFREFLKNLLLRRNSDSNRVLKITVKATDETRNQPDTLENNEEHRNTQC